MERFYEIEEFTYNGFYGDSNPEVIMPYQAKFKEWTQDPGIAIFECTDGEERYIPTFAVVGFRLEHVDSQEKSGMMFGLSCSSDDKVRQDARL